MATRASIAAKGASSRRRAVSVLTVVFAALACRGPASALDPAGPQAAQIADLMWLMTAISSAIVVAVAALLGVAIIRRSRPALWPAGRVSDTGIILVGGILVPALVLPVLWALTLRDMRALSEPPGPPTVTIEITAHQWWYDVRYPIYGQALRDELYLPAGQPVLLRVTSADVIHSLWIPRLGGKIDMIPGRVNEVWIQADQPGSYPVLCAEFCGLWHARMEMNVVVETVAAFNQRMGRGP